MHVISLQSGSNGNCIYVEAGGARLLFDAGISGIKAKQRLAQHGRDIAEVDAVLVSHDHNDHARSMGIFHRKFDLPIYATRRTHEAAGRFNDLGAIRDLRHFAAGEKIRFGDATVETIPTPHDGADGVAFVIDDGRRRLGILTDLGHLFAELESVIASLDAVVLESNFDPEMLADGPYPEFLKRRIEGPRGHLSNFEAADILNTKRTGRMQWACLAHLSEHNNTPDIALETHRTIVGDEMPIYVAARYEASAVMRVV